MHNLIEKYRNDELSAGEMGELRQLLDRMSDPEIGAELEGDWLESAQAMSGQPAPDNVEQRVGRSIMRDINPRKRWLSLLYKGVAAGIAAFLCVTAGFFLHDRLMSPDSGPVQITADANETTEIVFPDGSCVSVNPRSSLSYETVPSAGHDRNIRFDGIGHFNIAKDSEHPFVVSAEALDVTVMGTEFYLAAESDATSASLYLQDGSVDLLSRKTAHHVTMKPGDMAVLDYATGQITVTSDASLVNVFKASDRVRLNYDDVPLGSVVASLNTCYAPFHICLDSDQLAGLKFTGSLPKNNLMEALSVLEYTANLKMSVSNSEITLYR